MKSTEEPSEPDRPADRFLEPARIEPRTAEHEPDAGAKLFVLFFFLIVPPLGVALLVLMCWSMWKAFNA